MTSRNLRAAPPQGGRRAHRVEAHHNRKSESKGPRRVSGGRNQKTCSSMNHHDRESQSSFSKSPIRSRPAQGAPQRGPEQGSSQESRESQSKIPSIAILDPRPSRPEIFDHRSSIHRNPIPPRFTESKAEKPPSARCNSLKRVCAGA